MILKIILKLKKLKNNPLVIIIISSLIINCLLWAYSSYLFFQSTDLIPLHYTIYFGIDLIDYKAKIFIYPLTGLMTILVNTFLAYLFKKEKLLGFFLTSTSVLVQFIILITEISLMINYY